MTVDVCNVYLTARDGGARLSAQEPVVLTDMPANDARCSVVVRPRTRYQQIEGFGGAFTEAAATTWQKLPDDLQAEVIRAYFDPDDGLGYTLGRTHMNSCDFATGNYACAPASGDTALASFTLEREQQGVLPMMHAANTAAGSAVKLLVSPWSPPAWMKDTGKMNDGGKLLPEYREAWAAYYVRFIRELAEQDIAVWALTVQNEPAAVQTWDSCVYTAAEERDFVRDHLGPALHEAGMEDVKLLIWDHNRDKLFERAQVVLDDPEAAKYVWGAGFHWYGDDCFDNVQRVHDAWPDKQLLFTEGCQEGGPHDGSWLLGERYARSIIADLNRWTVGWLDWNLLLDQTGGPNHVGNLCSAPILANTELGELAYQNSYYYMGHFSRFIRPGAVRILAAASTDRMEVTAAQNTDGSIVVVVLNRTEYPIDFDLRTPDRGSAITSPPRSIMTLCYPDAIPHE